MACPAVLRVATLVAACCLAVSPIAAARTEATPSPRPGAVPTPMTRGLADHPNPWLRQEADSPTGWLPWGADAFALARREQRPVLVAIGFETCRDCRRLDRDQFRNPDLAALVRRHFVAVKVDRDERPDVDDFAQAAAEELATAGGWPLLLFLTPDREPFLAATDASLAAEGGMSSLPRLLESVARSWKEDRPSLVALGRDVLARLEGRSKEKSGPLDLLVLRRGAAHFASVYDAEHAGFQMTPKLPLFPALQFLLRYGQRSGDETARQLVVETLDRISRGAITDILGGGIHPQTADAAWQQPDFRKTLVDQAMLVRTGLEAWQATTDVRYLGMARETLTYVKRDLTAPGGGFFGAEAADAGSDPPGNFYLWSRAEVLQALGDGPGPMIADLFGLTAAGGKRPLTIPVPAETFMKSRGRKPLDFLQATGAARAGLFAVRNQRPRPPRATLLPTAANGILLAALAEGASPLQAPAHLEAARRLAERWLEAERKNGALPRAIGNGKSIGTAFLDDQASLILGLHALYEATGEGRWLAEADRLAHDMIRRFEPAAGGPLRYTPNGAEVLPVRVETREDAATPSGRSVAAWVLLRLGHLRQETRFTESARTLLQANGTDVARSPTAYPFLLLALDFDLGPRQTILLTGDPSDKEWEGMREALRRTHLPRAVLALLTPGDEEVRRLLPEALRAKAPAEGVAVVVCEDGGCRAPARKLEELQEILNSLTAPPPARK